MITLYLQKSYITKAQADIVMKISQTSHHNIDDILLACGFASSKEVAKVKAQRLNTEYIDLNSFTPHKKALKLIPRSKAIEYSILPLIIKDSKLIIAIDERADYKHKIYLERTSKMDVSFVISSKREILNQLMTHDYYTKDDKTLAKINELKLTSKENVNIIDLVDLLIEDAIEDNVSDIHISPEKDMINVFYRIDGVLIHYHTLPKEFQKRIISRIKHMSSLDIAQTNLPQDGQLEYNYLSSDFRLRVSSINTAYGENIVMRILKNDASNLDLNHLGLSQKNNDLMTKLFSQPTGLVLVTGPTGSGKTTTLYSSLKEVDSLGKNIITVEDPIEYQIPFITQTQVNTKIGYTFDTAIRAFMRQDPDVILVGEIRDEETAQLALRASITGHLVLSTLHTNDAVSAISRLADLKIPEYLIGSATMAIVAQRLLRKLCTHCKVKVENQEEEIKKYNIPSYLLTEHKDFTIYKPKGCEKCLDIGYSSREMIVEILVIDKHIEDMIVKSKSSLEILEYASSKGMRTMLHDGYSKVLDGKTSFEEIERMLVSI
ncbi:MAG: type II secretion system protein E [Epsilonproteobacteria bacterium]|nr:MAG: type II secretion system protein E [Campylobacterota bacterium]